MDGRMWFCIIGSIIATAIGVLWFLIGVCSSKQMRKRMVIAPLHGLLVGVATGFFLIFIDRNITFGVNGLDAVITTILNILRVFSGEDGLMDTREKLVGIPDIYQDLMWT
ncbi:MAG: hypothetical protein VB095_11505, partial [Anaerovorax sp.]|nr:hypothetical protein [Anaerovorax sp.]